MKERIKTLIQQHKDFVKKYENNESVKNSYQYGGQLIKQLQIISALCKEEGIDNSQFEDKIRKIRIKYLGEKFVNKNYK